MKENLFLNIKKYRYILIAVAVIILDQAAKLLVLKYLAPNSTFHIIPKLFDFVFVKNTGAAFSILSEHTAVLGIVSVLFCAGVVVYLHKKKPESVLMRTSLALLFAGAFGNAVDRIFRGYVIDFISTVFMNFPVFNVADIAITFGAALLVIYLIWFDKEAEEE